MLDADLAELYGVMTAALNQQVKRNSRRFPEDFAFQLTKDEFDALISQIVTSKTGCGGRRKPPWVFTEHGVAVLSSVLRSDRAADVNVAIMRTFVRLRRTLATNEELARIVAEHDRIITDLCDRVDWLLAPAEIEEKNSVGFQHPRKGS